MSDDNPFITCYRCGLTYDGRMDDECIECNLPNPNWVREMKRQRALYNGEKEITKKEVTE